MSGQNILHAPGAAGYPGRRLEIEDALLLFHSENQCCYRWGTEPDGDDSLVFGREGDGDPWRPEGVTLSEHLVLACLFEGVMSHSAFTACASWVDGAPFEAIRRRVPALAIGPWAWPDMAFHCGSGAFMIANPMGEHAGRHGLGVWIGARRREALAFLHPLIDGAVSSPWESDDPSERVSDRACPTGHPRPRRGSRASHPCRRPCAASA